MRCAVSKGICVKVSQDHVKADLQPTSHVEFHTTAIIDPLFVAPTFLQVDGELSTSCSACFRVDFQSWDHAMQSVVVFTDLGVESAESGIAETGGTDGSVRWSGFSNRCHLIEDLEEGMADL